MSANKAMPDVARMCDVGKMSPAQLTAALEALSNHLGGQST